MALSQTDWNAIGNEKTDFPYVPYTSKKVTFFPYPSCHMCQKSWCDIHTKQNIVPVLYYKKQKNHVNVKN